MSNESGRSEVFVPPFMGPGVPRDGNTFRANPAQKWSEQPISERPTTRPFDLHPDAIDSS
jgi:hypothetical protein